MEDIEICMATGKDREQLMEYFSHYNSNEIIKNRIDCYTSHNCTIIAKHKNKIVGTLQWYLKESPKLGVVEFEEMHVLEDYRGKGIASSMIIFAINSVKDFFKKIHVKPRRIFLFVSEKNKIARRLYEKHGFQKSSDVGNLMSDNENELIYSLKL